MRMAQPDLPRAHSRGVDSPLDRALALLLAGEREAALRWSAAVVQQDASVSSALILTCRLLADSGRTEAAIEGFELGVERAIDTGNLPLAVAALGDLRALGVEEDMAHSSIRFGLGRFTTEEEVDFVVSKVVASVNELRNMSPLYEMAKEGIDIKSIQWAAH